MKEICLLENERTVTLILVPFLFMILIFKYFFLKFNEDLDYGTLITLTNNARITANDLTIQTNSTSGSSITFGTNSSINKNSTTAINRIYSNGGVQFTNQFQMNGKAGLVVAMGAFNLNSNAVAPETVFVSNSGQSGVSGNVRIGGIYTNGSLNINSSPTIDFGSKKDTILQSLDLGGGGAASATLQAGSWSSK